jgi:hypothetical protein
MSLACVAAIDGSTFTWCRALALDAARTPGGQRRLAPAVDLYFYTVCVETASDLKKSIKTTT